MFNPQSLNAQSTKAPSSSRWDVGMNETSIKGFNWEEAGSGQSDVLAESFPCKLHLMLVDVERQGLGHIVSWQPHGKCFAVHKRKSFVDHIMPIYFRTSKFASFQRQLNIYGFQRLTTGRDKGGYYHELFLRSRQELCYSITRQKVKGTRVRKPAEPKNEPNFYLLANNKPLDSMKSSEASDAMPLSSMLAPSASNDTQQMTTTFPMDSATTSHLLLALASSGKQDLAAKSMMRYSNHLKPTLTSMTAAGLTEDQQCDAYKLEARRFSLFSTSQTWQDAHSANLVPEPIMLCHQHPQQLLLQDDIEASIEALLGALAHLD